MNSNAAVYFVDRHIDEGRADKPAFIEVDGANRSISYGDLSHQSALFARALSRADEAPHWQVAKNHMQCPTINWTRRINRWKKLQLNSLNSSNLSIFLDNEVRNEHGA